MANHKSAEKRNRQSETRRARNKAHLSRMKTEIKKFMQLIEDNDLTSAQKLFSQVAKVIQKTSTKGAIPKNRASRKISRLAQRLNKTA